MVPRSFIGRRAIGRRGESGHMGAMARQEPRGSKTSSGATISAAWYPRWPPHLLNSGRVVDIDGDNGILREFHDVREIGLQEWTSVSGLAGAACCGNHWGCGLRVPEVLEGARRGRTCGAEDSHTFLARAGTETRR